MKRSIACLAALAATTTAARADDDPGMQIMSLMMKLPAMSSDGKHIAIFSQDPGSDKAAMTSVAVFSTAGKLEKRIPVVPPATDVKKAKAAVAKINALLTAGGYARMARIAQEANKYEKPNFSLTLSSEGISFDIKFEARKLEIKPTKDGATLPTITKKLPAKDGRCKKPDAFSLSNTQAGFDAKSGAFAFSIDVEQGGEVCFAHNFVVTIK